MSEYDGGLGVYLGLGLLVDLELDVGLGSDAVDADVAERAADAHQVQVDFLLELAVALLQHAEDLEGVADVLLVVVRVLTGLLLGDLAVETAGAYQRAQVVLHDAQHRLSEQIDAAVGLLDRQLLVGVHLRVLLVQDLQRVLAGRLRVRHLPENHDVQADHGALQRGRHQELGRVVLAQRTLRRPALSHNPFRYD